MEIQNFTPATAPTSAVPLSMDTVEGFVGLQRVATLYANSNLVPDHFRGQVANTFIALELALRVKAAPMTILQNLYVIHGKPAWSTQFIISLFNATGRFSSIKYEMEGEDQTRACTATCVELATGERIVGPKVTMQMAAQEGWSTKNGSKWRTMPDLMLRYRAAAFLVRTTAPEVAFGIYSVEEMQDVYSKAAPQREGRQKEPPRLKKEPPVEAEAEDVETSEPAGEQNQGE